MAVSVSQTQTPSQTNNDRQAGQVDRLPIAHVGEKWCPRGRHWVAAEGFYRHRGSADGLRHGCKACEAHPQQARVRYLSASSPFYSAAEDRASLLEQARRAERPGPVLHAAEDCADCIHCKRIAETATW